MEFTSCEYIKTSKQPFSKGKLKSSVCLTRQKSKRALSFARINLVSRHCYTLDEMMKLETQARQDQIIKTGDQKMRKIW